MSVTVLIKRVVTPENEIQMEEFILLSCYLI